MTEREGDKPLQGAAEEALFRQQVLQMQEGLRRSVEHLNRSLERLQAQRVPAPEHAPRGRGLDGHGLPDRQGRDDFPPRGLQGMRKFINPPKFSGEEMNWEEYLVRFELVAEWNRWSEDEACEGLLLSLEGDAATHAHGISGFRRLGYAELCDILAGRFGSARSLAEDKRKFRMRKKKPEESYAHMAQDIARLARRIYRGDPQMAEVEAREQFVKGLPSRIRIAVAAANPRTLDDCVDSVSQLQIVLDTETFAEVEGAPVKTAVAQVDGRLAEGKQESGRNFRRGRGRNSNDKRDKVDRSNVTCWNCGERGHFRNKCPQQYRFKKEQVPPKGPKGDHGRKEGRKPGAEDVAESENEEGSSE